MASTVAGGIQVVVVLTSDTIRGAPTKQLWVAAVPREEAVAAVLKVVPAGWSAELSDQHLSPERAARLKLRPGEVREFGSAT